MTVTFFGWGPMFNLRSPSPFVMKTEIQLQMLGVQYQRAVPDLEAVAKHKAPYVRDGEQLIQDSTFIRFHFEKKLGKDLDAGLTAEQRATAWALERMLEDRLYFIVLHERWVEEENFQRGPAQFFAAIPENVRPHVIAQVRDGVVAMLHRQGLGRHSRAERMELAARDFAALSAFLGNRLFFFGDKPSALDAVASAFIASCTTRFFDSPLPDLADQHANFQPYLRRVNELFPTQPF